eukprot:SAG11_NODE_630_length_8069_cov_2.158344_5_plen_50_part_00
MEMQQFEEELARREALHEEELARRLRANMEQLRIDQVDPSRERIDGSTS